MAIIEVLTLKVGSAVGKALLKGWLGDNELAADATASISEILAKAGLDFRERRRLSREIDEATERVADLLTPFFEAEDFLGLPENEREAAALAVARTVELGFTSASVVFDADLGTERLETSLRASCPTAAQDAFLNAAATRLYDIALSETCACIIAMVESLPRFASQAFAELLNRDRAVLERLDEALDNLPTTDVEQALQFETYYLREVARVFDQVQLYGLTGEAGIYRYRLSVAYLTLTAAVTNDFKDDLALEQGVVGEYEEQITRSSSAAPQATLGTYVLEDDVEDEDDDNVQVVRVDRVIGSSRRLLIRGDAGSGKTTLLQWLAVNAARSSFSYEMSELNGLTPFMIHLRRYTNSSLPMPADFVHAASPMLVGLMPQGWVEERLKAGRVLLLIDGVDELQAGRREEVRIWLHQILAAFPDCRIVVTSRPPAVGGDWLGTADFNHCVLEPLSLSDVDEFIDHWHLAVASDVGEVELEALQEQRAELKRAIRKSAPVRRLATTPLLCAMLCALNRRGNARLPEDRVELYRIALEMLLQNRDAVRKVTRPDLPDLGLKKKMTLLQELAYWLVRNDYVDAPRSLAVAQLNRTLDRVDSKLEGAEVFDTLLQRTGLLREPVAGQIDFIHRTFLEYLAARAAVDAGDIGVLAEHAADDSWSEIIVLAAGCAIQEQRHELISALLEGASLSKRAAHRCKLLAVACLENAPELDPALSDRVREALATLVPPRSIRDASELASAGSLAVAALAPSGPMKAVEARASVRALGLIGTEEAMEQLALFGRDSRVTVIRELVRQWSNFDVGEYAQRVLADSPLESGYLEVPPDIPTGVLHKLTNLRRLAVLDGRLASKEDLQGLRLSQLSLNCELDIEDIYGYGSFDTLKAISANQQGRLRSVTGIGRYEQLRTVRMRGCLELDDLNSAQGEWPSELSTVSIADLEGVDLATFANTSIATLRLRCGYLESFDALGDMQRLSELQLVDVGTDIELHPLIDADELHILTLTKCMGAIDVVKLGREEAPLERLAITECPRLYDVCEFGRANEVRVSGQSSLRIKDLETLMPLRCDIQSEKISDLEGFPASVTHLRLDCPRLESLSGLSDSPVERLVLNRAVNLNDLAVVAGLSKLRYFAISELPRSVDVGVLQPLLKSGCVVRVALGRGSSWGRPW